MAIIWTSDGLVNWGGGGGGGGGFYKHRLTFNHSMDG